MKPQGLTCAGSAFRLTHVSRHFKRLIDLGFARRLEQNAIP